jgi:hypothetical protein
MRSLTSMMSSHRCQVAFVISTPDSTTLRGDILMAARTSSPSKQKNSRAAAEALAQETERPVEEVQKIYEEELSELANEAKVTQYLGVLASRRVKMRLRKH